MTRGIVTAALVVVGSGSLLVVLAGLLSRAGQLVDDAVTAAFEDDEPVSVDEIQAATGARFLLAMSAAAQKGDPEVLRFMEVLKGGGVL